jgi:hypothetical protein
MNLTADGIVALDAIGFDWGSEIASHKRFQDRVKALVEYKERNGHLHVRETDDQSLYIWCRNIRCARRGTGTMKLTADGIAALDAIGYD